MSSSGSFEATRGPSASDTGNLLPTQFNDLIRRRTALDGEQRLMLAVLEDAVRCYLRLATRHDRDRSSEYREVVRWFGLGRMTPSAAASPFDFENLCDSLSVDPSRLRDKLVRLTLAELPARRFQTRRHRPLATLRSLGSRSKRAVRNHV